MSNIKIFLKEILLTIGLALIISLLLQNYILEARVVPTGSMLPTIIIDQRVLINKLSYRLSPPQRGDVIVFRPPMLTEDNKDYIKRVIGLSGEVVEIRNGRILINGEVLKENYIHEKPQYNYGPVVIPENSLFVLGDNRNLSFDSHAWDQWLKLENVKGKAFFTYWPLKNLGLLR